MSSVADLPPINFTATQAVAVSVALASLPDNGPFAADARAAAGKILDALSAADRDRAGMLAERVWVMESAEMDTAEVTRRSIERSLAERRALAIVYRSADGEVTKRIVEPIILAGERHW
jgi:predicted DNA-binding transcriptional regulator YafY